MIPNEEVQGFQETAYRAFLATITSFTAYGIHVSIGSASIYLILSRKRESPYASFHVTFIGLLLVLGTINVALWGLMMAESTQLVFLPPHAPEFDVLPRAFVASGAGSAAASALITAMCDALLLYRCWVIWEQRIYIILLPLLAYLAAIGLGVADVILFWSYRSRHGLIPYPKIYPITAGYWFTLLSLNILLTILIVGRIIYLIRCQYRHPETHTGQTQRKGGSMATAIVGMFAESSLLYTLAVIVGLALNWWFFASSVIPRQAIPLMIAFEVSPFNPYLTHLECVATELIILRVALGRAWRQSTERTTDVSESMSEPTMEAVRFRSPTSVFVRTTIEVDRPVDTSRSSLSLASCVGMSSLDAISREGRLKKDGQEEIF